MDKSGKSKTKIGEPKINRLHIYHLYMNGGMGDVETLLNIVRS